MKIIYNVRTQNDIIHTLYFTRIEHNLIEAILKTHDKLPEYFIYYGFYTNNVPFIISAHMKASYMKPYVKLGE